MRTVCALAMLMAVTGAVEVAAADKIAVFPLEVPDFIAEGEYLPKPAKEGPRAKLATDELTKLVAATGKYEVVDLNAFAADLKKAQPLYKCNGCAGDLAKTIGARYMMTGIVEKGSDTLFNMSLQLADVEADKVVALGSTIIQGNTDEMWLRGVRYLMKNRIDPKEEGK